MTDFTARRTMMDDTQGALPRFYHVPEHSDAMLKMTALRRLCAPPARRGRPADAGGERTSGLGAEDVSLSLEPRTLGQEMAWSASARDRE